MANIPILLSMADDFGRLQLASTPYYESLVSHLKTPHWIKQLQLRLHDLLSTVGPVSTIGKDGFQLSMDVQQFKPCELTVKVLDHCVVVEGKHEEREDDHGNITRHIVRRCALPRGYDQDEAVSTLSSDGLLTVNVPKPHIEDKSNVRHIQIQQVGPAHLNVKANPKEQIDGAKEKAASKKETLRRPNKVSDIPFNLSASFTYSLLL